MCSGAERPALWGTPATPARVAFRLRLVTAAFLEQSTEHQARARVALTAALAAGPSHAYLFRGPRGAGKSLVARAFVAEILAAGASDAEDARRRVLLDP